MYHSFMEIGQGRVPYMQQCVHGTKIHDIDDLRKRLMQTWFDFEQDVIDAAIDQWSDHLRSCVCVLVEW